MERILLVNIFGYWINPDRICDLQDRAYGCYVNYGETGTELRAKTSEQIVEEINRQEVIRECLSKPAIVDSPVLSASFAETKEIMGINKVKKIK